MWFKTLLSCFLTLIVFGVSAQTYSNDRAKFVKEFEKQISEFGRGESKEFAKKKLEPMLLESTAFPDAYFTTMVNTCNLLEEKRFGTYPEIFHYIFSVCAFVESKQSKESYTAWHATVDKLIDNKNKEKFTDFIEFSAGFFSVGRIAESSDFSWFYIGGSFTFESQKNAVINFTGGNLVCRVESNGKIVDSVNVMKTAGVYDPTLKKWEGAGGTITWERVGLDPKTNFATLNSFNISTRRSAFNVDTVNLTSTYFKAPIQGRLAERASKISKGEEVDFPQFLAFRTDLEIENVVENVNYVGGFELKGASFFGTGTTTQPSRIVIKRDGKDFIVARSSQIIVDAKRIRIAKAETSLYLNTGDSLYHPGLDFLYDLENKSVQLSRTGTGIGQAAFQDKYHQLDIFVPRIIWKVDSDELSFTYEFGTGPEKRMARFESANFFDERLYDRLQGLSSVHPLVSLANYSYKYDEQTMNSGKAASALGLEKDQAVSILVQLSNLGFINFDTELDVIQINQKLLTFVKAKAGTMDYDNIIFVSDQRPKNAPQLEGKTAIEIKNDKYLHYIDSIFTDMNEQRRNMTEYAHLDLKTLNLNIYAIDNVMLSQIKSTNILPAGNEVFVRKNRDFNFSGWVFAGKAEINTVAASFTYDDFTIKLLETKETVLNVTPFQKEHGPGLVRMKSEINGISGTLIVDHKNNKSGKNPLFDMYPRLVAENNSKIYYSSKDIYRGAYDSSRFYYTLEPFTLDTLHKFVERGKSFKGNLVSAGIFPKMNEPVKIMPDYSFGFNTTAPSGGYTFYGSDAKYENKILLSNNGLQGNGTINFIESTSSTLKNSLFAFLPDSTVGIVNFINRPVEKGVQFPPVKSDEAYISYVPRKNILRASSLPQKELQFFDGQSTLRGTLIIQPEGMTGRGLMDMQGAVLVSDGFDYKRWDIDADTASFALKNQDKLATDEDPMALNTKNVSAHVSFKERKGEFNSNAGESEVIFPVNQYKCMMDKFTWFMDADELAMERAAEKDIAINQGVDLKGPNFFSIHPKQDSLQFRAPKAKFNAKEKVIYCDEVEYIDIADARIYPDSMKVIVRKKAKIDKFFNANIVANYITKFHQFQNAEVEIKARRDYSASGTYPYYDVDSNVYYIVMNDIKPDTSYQTRASGKVVEADGFKLSDKFDYYGDVSIRAANPLISFKGATRINHECDKFDRNWMAFTSEIDPKNIQIPVSKEMKDLQGTAISAGIVWRNSAATDSIGMYPTFLSTLVDPEDPIVMSASGYLQYNDDANEFQISSKEKLINRMEVGNFIALHTESCSMNGDGEISLGMDFGDVNVDAVGIVNYNQTTGETSMNITARFDMALDKGMMQDVADRINGVEGLKIADFTSTTLDQAIRTWEDDKTAETFKADFVTKGEVKKIPKGLDYSMTFTGIRLSSYSGNQTTGLITNVQSAVLVNIYGKPVMKYVPFQAFYQQIYSGGGSDKFTMMIDIPGGRDYFMHYSMVKKDGTLFLKTGDTELSTTISEMKEDKRKTKNFKYELTSNSAFKTVFLELFAE